MDHRFPLTASILLTLSALPGSALALPPQQTATDTVDDALLELTLLEQKVEGDSRSFCQLRINVAGTEVPFTAGDTIELWVYEEDPIGNDELWTTSFTVTAAEVSAQTVDRTLDCGSDFGSDGVGSLEIFGEARVTKDACGTFCLQDNPTTPNLIVEEIADDASEDDDTAATSVPLSPGAPVSRVAADADYHQFAVASDLAVEATLSDFTSAGRIDAEIVDSGGTTVATVTDTPTGGAIETTLPAGTYHVRVTPRGAPDYAFYDLQVNLSTVSCTSGAIETRDCGDCGTQARTCVTGEWGSWGVCQGEGVCSPGTMDTQVCAAGGTQTRACQSTCDWGPFGECVGSSSNDDAGMAEVDGGTPPSRDAAMPPTVDGGTEPTDPGTSGGCSVGPAGGPRSAVWLVVAGMALFGLRSRRRCRRGR